MTNHASSDTTTAATRLLTSSGTRDALSLRPRPLSPAGPVTAVASGAPAASDAGDDGPLALTVLAAAKRLGISRSLLYEELRSGRLHPVKIGHLTRIRLQELDRYLRQQEVDRIA
jgi:excisionase family DNA binding protein